MSTGTELGERPTEGEVTPTPTVTPTEGPSNVVLIGRKSALVYAVAALMQLNNFQEVSLKARGRAISKAVDVVEILRRRFVPNLEIVDIKIGTEVLPPREETGASRPRNISTIEIKIRKKPE